jgi:ribosomal protein S18 acetylase RimI-like enzyme
MQITQLSPSEIALIAEIDRSEIVEIEYQVVDGQLIERAITMSRIPNWDPTGTGPFSVAAQIAFCAAVLAGGATLLGATVENQTVGLAIVDTSFEPGLAWLAFLHVDRSSRRRGAASALWSKATEMARAAGAESMYVSATPTGSAIGFYLSRGCRLANPVHPRLFSNEPDDIHLLYSLA